MSFICLTPVGRPSVLWTRDQTGGRLWEVPEDRASQSRSDLRDVTGGTGGPRGRGRRSTARRKDKDLEDSHGVPEPCSTTKTSRSTDRVNKELSLRWTDPSRKVWHVGVLRRPGLCRPGTVSQGGHVSSTRHLHRPTVLCRSLEGPPWSPSKRGRKPTVRALVLPGVSTYLLTDSSEFL